MSWQLLVAAIGSAIMLTVTIIAVERLRRFKARGTHGMTHGIDIRLTSMTGVLMQIDCDSLGLAYLYGAEELRDSASGDVVLGSIGFAQPRSNSEGWLTLETLHTAAGLVMLQCRPTLIGRVQRGR